jgi:hypothetical protein
MSNHQAPLVVACGLGVDSTALLVGFTRRGIRPDLILFADTGGEKEETYDYRLTLDQFLQDHGLPTVTVVRKVVRDFKNWPPYVTLEQNCLTNGTLPSLAFGFKSCSLKWKAAPQHAYVKRWQPALECWASGGRVTKAIGFDAGPRDQRRRNHAGNANDPRYEYWYPLIEWGWDRYRCQLEILKAGLPVPPKSSCFFCPAMKPDEVRDLPRNLLRRIVALEARAKPRLQTIQGLWRNGCKGTRGAEKRPGSITEFIKDESLLSKEEIEAIRRRVPLEIVAAQEAHRDGQAVPSCEEFFCSLEQEGGKE